MDFFLLAWEKNFLHGLSFSVELNTAEQCSDSPSTVGTGFVLCLLAPVSNLLVVAYMAVCIGTDI